MVESIAIVTFTKKNGELRKMKCTLKPELLPPFEDEEEPSGRKVNEEVLPVWDVEAEGWRSFRIDSVKEVSNAVAF